jgi:hypothetical protein
MSEMRPPITAGPIQRTLRFLKYTSLNCTGPPAAGTALGGGVGELCAIVGEIDAAGDAVGDAND